MVTLNDVTAAAEQYALGLTQPLQMALNDNRQQLAALQQKFTTLTIDFQKATEALALANATIEELEAALAAIPDGDLDGEPIEEEGMAFGLSTHTNYRTSVYGNDDKLMECTLATGASWIRDLLAISFPERDALWRKYVENGIVGFHVTVGRYSEPETSKPRIIAELLKSADIIFEATGWNEPDSNGRTYEQYSPSLIAWQKWLWTTIKNNPTLSHIQVGLGALRGENPNGRRDTQRLMAACKGYFDFVDIHCYPGPRPDDEIRKDLDDHILWGEGSRVVISECGGSTMKMSEAEQARVIRTILLHLAEREVDAYVYEVLDDPETVNNADLQSNFGVFESDYTPKGAAVVLAELAGI